MADAPQRASPLSAAGRSGGESSAGGNVPGVTVNERIGLSILQLETRDPGLPALTAVCKRMGIEAAPEINRAAISATHTVVWTGPGRWLLVSEERAGDAKESQLREQIGDGAAITDLGHARTVLRVSGDTAGELLAKGCPVDVENMAAGECCASLIAHSTVIIHCLGGGDGFDVYVARSYARSLWEWLQDAAMEYREL